MKALKRRGFFRILTIFIMNILPMTINQALDKILTKYKNSELDKYPDIASLKFSLVELKIFWGGNHKLENPRKVSRIIETGKD